MTKRPLILLGLAFLTGCHGTPQPTETTQTAKPSTIGDDRLFNRNLLDAEVRTLLEIQDSFRMMLVMGSKSPFDDRRIVWTDEQRDRGNQLSTDIVNLLSRYTLEKTVRSNHPVPMDPVLFGREVEKLGQRRSALWLSLVESNGLPESARSIFHNGLYPPR